MEYFAKIVKGLKTINYFRKTAHPDIWQGSEYSYKNIGNLSAKRLCLWKRIYLNRTTPQLFSAGMLNDTLYTRFQDFFKKLMIPVRFNFLLVYVDSW